MPLVLTCKSFWPFLSGSEPTSNGDDISKPEIAMASAYRAETHEPGGRRNAPASADQSKSNGSAQGKKPFKKFLPILYAAAKPRLAALRKILSRLLSGRPVPIEPGCHRRMRVPTMPLRTPYASAEATQPGKKSPPL